MTGAPKYKPGDRVIALRWPRGGAGVIVKSAPVRSLVRWDGLKEDKNTSTADIRPETVEDVTRRGHEQTMQTWQNQQPKLAHVSITSPAMWGSTLPGWRATPLRAADTRGDAGGSCRAAPTRGLVRRETGKTMTLDHPTPLSKLGELSEDDLGTLQRAADLRRRFDAGIFPSTIGQRSHFRKLVRLGLLEFDDWGRDIDGAVERDVMIYKLTERGSEAVATAEQVRTAACSAAEAAAPSGTPCHSHRCNDGEPCDDSRETCP